jgi:hypothetical protein
MRPNSLRPGVLLLRLIASNLSGFGVQFRPPVGSAE